jgi:uncharacterized protein (DUF736 family)
MDTMDYAEADANAQRRPQFFIKQNGEVIGAAWLKESQSGKYLSVAVNKDIHAGSKVFLSPRKGFEGVFG